MEHGEEGECLCVCVEGGRMGRGGSGLGRMILSNSRAVVAVLLAGEQCQHS